MQIHPTTNMLICRFTTPSQKSSKQVLETTFVRFPVFRQSFFPKTLKTQTPGGYERIAISKCQCGTSVRAKTRVNVGLPYGLGPTKTCFGKLQTDQTFLFQAVLRLGCGGNLRSYLISHQKRPNKQNHNDLWCQPTRLFFQDVFEHVEV